MLYGHYYKNVSIVQKSVPKMVEGNEKTVIEFSKSELDVSLLRFEVLGTCLSR